MRLITILLTIILYCLPAYAQCPNPRPGCSQWNGDMTVTGGDYSFTGASWFYQSVPNSTTAFQILSSSGGSIVTVDTVNARMAIGTSLLDETLVLGGNGPGIHIFSSQDSNQEIFFEIDTGTPTGWAIRHDKSTTGNPNGLSFRQNTIGQVMELDIDGNLRTLFGRDINETIYTTTDNILTTDDLVWGDTDGGSFVLTIHDGSGGQRHTVTNSGDSGNALTLTSDGSDTIDGGASLVLYDGETAIICFNSTDNEWRP